MNLISSVSGHFRYLKQEETSQLLQDRWLCPYCREEDIDSPLVTHSQRPEQHSFHRRCIVPWVKEHGNCMVCFQPVAWEQIATLGESLSHHTPLKRVITPLRQFCQLAAASPKMQMFLFGLSLALAGCNTDFRFATSFGFLVLSGSFFFQRREWSGKCTEFSATLSEINRRMETLKAWRSYMQRQEPELSNELSRRELGQKRLRKENVQQVRSTKKKIEEVKQKIRKTSEELKTTDRALDQVRSQWQSVQTRYRNSQMLWFVCALTQCAALATSIWLLYPGAMPQEPRLSLRS